MVSRSSAWRIGPVLGGVVLAAPGCGSQANSPSILRAAGLGAVHVARLWWQLFAIASAVFGFVTILIVVAILRRHRPPVQRDQEVGWGGRFILWAGVIVPALILSGTFVLTLHDMTLLAAPGRRAKLTIQVVGHDWWWEARYPDGTTTANEIHIPTGEPVRLQLTTADVIHTFWVPQLQTKTDMIPGRTNEMWLQTDSPGRYRGQCAQFCGLQHAHMILYVVADSPGDFQLWLGRQAAPAASSRGQGTLAAQGEQVFLSQTCAGCHSIRGTPATARVGPDLTHLASRQTIAAGTLDNNGDNLASWLTDPQASKPGAIMPPTQLSASDLHALIAYLQSLQ